MTIISNQSMGPGPETKVREVPFAVTNQGQAITQNRPTVQLSEYATGFSKIAQMNAAGAVEKTTDSQLVMKARMGAVIQNLGRIFRNHYAPRKWKEETRNWNVDREVARALTSIQQTSPITAKKFHAIVKSFVNATGDYHVGARFYSTETATLPFTVKGTNGKFFVVHVDRTLAPDFPLNIGDEVVSFDGRPTAEVIADLQKFVGNNVPATDRGLAELQLTQRAGSRGEEVPQGELVVEVKSKNDDTVRAHTFKWDYTPEKLAYNGSDFLPPPQWSAPASQWEQFGSMITHHWRSAAIDGAANPFALGARESFVPKLGKVTWQSSPKSKLHAYMFKTPDGRKVGYVRIPHYQAGQAELVEFVQLVARFQLQTDALVIDQVNNPGGSVAYLYGLASMLSEKLLYTPRHRMSITQKEVVRAHEILEMTDEDFLALGNLPPELIDSMRDNARFIMQEWKEGRTLTRPYHLGMGDFITPSPIRFTKPIMILTNHLDFSGGDFFPAIMQDNKRATIFGSRTAGAGGYVQFLDHSPNLLGLWGVTYTGSIAERIDGSKIESDGVEPDVPYEFTENDIRDGFKDYKAAILSNLSKMIDENDKKKEEDKDKKEQQQ